MLHSRVQSGPPLGSPPAPAPARSDDDRSNGSDPDRRDPDGRRPRNDDPVAAGRESVNKRSAGKTANSSFEKGRAQAYGAMGGRAARTTGAGRTRTGAPRGVGATTTLCSQCRVWMSQLVAEDQGGSSEEKEPGPDRFVFSGGTRWPSGAPAWTATSPKRLLESLRCVVTAVARVHPVSSARPVLSRLRQGAPGSLGQTQAASHGLIGGQLSGVAYVGTGVDRLELRGEHKRRSDEKQRGSGNGPDCGLSAFSTRLLQALSLKSLGVRLGPNGPAISNADKLPSELRTLPSPHRERSPSPRRSSAAYLAGLPWYPCGARFSILPSAACTRPSEREAIPRSACLVRAPTGSTRRRRDQVRTCFACEPVLGLWYAPC